MNTVAVSQNALLGQTQRCSMKTSSRGVVGLPALRPVVNRAKSLKVFAHFDGRAERAQEVSTSGNTAFVYSATRDQMTSPANIMYTTQTRFTTLDRPALGTGQALGFVLAAAGVYIAMLISAFAFGKSDNKQARKKRFQSQNRIPLRSYYTWRVAPSEGIKRPYVQQALQMSNLLLQSDPPRQLQCYPARVHCNAH